MSIMRFASVLALACSLSHSVTAQQQNVQFNQVVNLNGDMQLNTLIFPDNSRIETFSQEQTQIIVNQNQAPLPASHVVGSTGQPFIQLSRSSMSIQTTGRTDLVGGQIIMPLDAGALAQNQISPDNTFVAMLSGDRQAWIIMEGIKSVNATDGTVRMVKLNNLAGEYVVVGRQTAETGQALTPFSQDPARAVTIAGSGIQEVEFQDGFRVSVRASQPMSINADVINGVTASMVVDGSMPVNNYRYLVTTSLGGVQAGLNNMAAVVQIPLNANRLMRMAQSLGAGPNDAVALGIAQRRVILNPGGVAGNPLQPVQPAQPAQPAQALQPGSKVEAAASAVTSPADATEEEEPENAPVSQGAEEAETGVSSAPVATETNAGNIETSIASDVTSTAAEATNTEGANNATATESTAGGAAPTEVAPPPPPPNNANQPPPQVAAPVQLLLEPTFSAVRAQAIVDQENGRVAVPVASLDGEFILTMALMGRAQPGQVAVNPGQAPPAQAPPAQAPPASNPNSPVTQPPAQSPPAEAAPPVNGAPVAEPAPQSPNGAVGGTEGTIPMAAKRQAAPASSGLVMSMQELRAMAQRQQSTGTLPVWQMMNQFANQEQARLQAQSRQASPSVERRDGPLKAVPFVG